MKQLPIRSRIHVTDKVHKFISIETVTNISVCQQVIAAIITSQPPLLTVLGHDIRLQHVREQLLVCVHREEGGDDGAAAGAGDDAGQQAGLEQRPHDTGMHHGQCAATRQGQGSAPHLQSAAVEEGRLRLVGDGGRLAHEVKARAHLRTGGKRWGEYDEKWPEMSATWHVASHRAYDTASVALTSIRNASTSTLVPHRLWLYRLGRSMPP